MKKNKILALLTALVLMLNFMPVFSVNAAETTTYDFEYDVQEVYYDFEFNDDTEFDKYLCTKQSYELFPEIQTLSTGEGVAHFDLSKLAGTSALRVGFKIPFNEDPAFNLRAGLNSGLVVYEFKAKFEGDSVDGLFFYPLANITGKRFYFSNMKNYSDSLDENKWHTFSVCLDYSSGSVEVMNVSVDGVIQNFTNVTDIAKVASVVPKSSDMTVSLQKTTSGTNEGTMTLDYLRVYKPTNYDDVLIKKRFNTSLKNSYKNYNDFDSNWLNLVTADGKFSDLNCTNSVKSSAYADRYTHVYRLKGMAAEYTQMGRTLRGNAELLEKLELATNYYVNAKFDQVGGTGDWSNALECPKVLADVFLMLRDYGYTLPSNWLTIADSHYFDQHRRLDVANNVTGLQFAMATSNLPITCQLWMALTILFDDFSYVEQIYTSLGETMNNHVDANGNGVMDSENNKLPATVDGVTFFGDGYYPDGSYYSHGPMHYTFGYGVTYVQGTSGYVKHAAGTKWQFTDDQLSVLVDIILENFRWIMRGNNSEFTALGRNLSVLDSNGKATNNKRQYLNAMLTPLLEEPNIPRRYELLKLQEDLRIDASTNNGSSASTNYVTGNKHFWQTDLMSHQRDNYSAILKMSSTRTLKSEKVSKEGTNGYYMATGTLPIMITGHEYENAIAVWDWDRLPGITALNKAEDVPELADFSHEPNRHFGSHSFVGGVSDGTYGAAAMDYSDNLKTKTVAEYNNPTAAPVVNAKKAWFFFDDEVVALGTDISSTDSANNLLTNLDQSILNGTVTYKDANGESTLSSESTASSESLSWVHHGNIGYVFPEAETAAVSNKAQTGNARREGDTTYPDYTRNIFSLYVDHGKGTTNDKYSYIVVPNKSASEISTYAGAIPVEILQNDGDIQAVYHKNLKIAQVVFRTAGSVSVGNYTITADKPCIAMAKFNANDINLYVQNPENKTVDIKLNVKYDGTSIGDVNFRTGNGLYAGQTVSDTLEIPEVLPEHTDVATPKYEVDEYILDLEFNDASEYTGATFDTNSGPVVVIDKETFNGKNVGKFKNSSSTIEFTGDTLAALKEAIAAGKVAIEMSFKEDTFDSKASNGFAFGAYNGGYLFQTYIGTGAQFRGGNNAWSTLTNGGWNTVTMVLDGTTADSVLKDVYVNDVAVNIGTPVASTSIDTLLANSIKFHFAGGKDANDAYLYTYVDYIRIYKVKEEKPEEPTPDEPSLGPDLEIDNNANYYYQYEFNDTTASLPSNGGFRSPVLTTFDGKGVAQFVAGKVSCMIPSKSGQNFQDMKAAISNGREVRFDFNIYYTSLSNEFNMLNGFMFNNSQQKFVSDGNVHQSFGKNAVVGWNTISFTVYQAEDGLLYYKDFTLNGESPATSSMKFTSRYDTVAEFFDRDDPLKFMYYGSGGQDVYVDYIRIYEKEDVVFINENNEKAATLQDASYVSVSSDLIKDGAAVFAAFFNNSNTLIGTNQFILTSDDTTNASTVRALVKPANTSDIKIFVFDGLEAIKPLTSSVLFSDTIN